MKKGIHPEYKDTVFRCACGAEIATKSTKDDSKLEICSSCHPFFTGKQKLIDSAGRVERFLKKYGDKPVAVGKKSTAKPPKKEKSPISKARPKAAPKEKAQDKATKGPKRGATK